MPPGETNTKRTSPSREVLDLSVRSRLIRLLLVFTESDHFTVADLLQPAFRAEHDTFHEQSAALFRRFESAFRGEPEGLSADVNQFVSHAFFLQLKALSSLRELSSKPFPTLLDSDPQSRFR